MKSDRTERSSSVAATQLARKRLRSNSFCGAVYGIILDKKALFPLCDNHKHN